jgi:hypothetical protein
VLTKPSKWLVDIPRTSVVLVNPEFNKSGARDRKRMTAMTLKKLLSIAEIDYCYLNAERGLVLKREATQILEENYEELRGSRSQKGRAAESKALSFLTAHKRCLDFVHSRTSSRKRARLSAGTIDDGTSGQDAQDVEEEENA